MADIHIRRDHTLGRARARELATQWAEKATRKFGVQCTLTTGDEGDTVAFARSGVDGRLVVADDHLEIDAKLGLLMGAFSQSIGSEIEKQLDELLAAPPRRA